MIDRRIINNRSVYIQYLRRQNKYNRRKTYNKKTQQTLTQRKQNEFREKEKKTKKRVNQLYKQYIAWLVQTGQIKKDCNCGNGGITKGW